MPNKIKTIQVMGMYTELILGAELKKDTPDTVINALKYMLGEIGEKPKDFPLPEGRCEWIFQGSSYYFGINRPVNKAWVGNIRGQYVISARCNIKNYGGEIEEVLEWLKPYIETGSGSRDMFAITMHEESSTPTIYYLS